ncbi:MAG: hypothetical protein IPP74_02725 [Alphaproteobacteria bacterium]|nr:hypothetical protein [Alphaproteobacteria bacterium]
MNHVVRHPLDTYDNWKNVGSATLAPLFYALKSTSHLIAGTGEVLVGSIMIVGGLAIPVVSIPSTLVAPLFSEDGLGTVKVGLTATVAGPLILGGAGSIVVGRGLIYNGGLLLRDATKTGAALVLTLPSVPLAATKMILIGEKNTPEKKGRRGLFQVTRDLVRGNHTPNVNNPAETHPDEPFYYFLPPQTNPGLNQNDRRHVHNPAPVVFPANIRTPVHNPAPVAVPAYNHSSNENQIPGVNVSANNQPGYRERIQPSKKESPRNTRNNAIVQALFKAKEAGVTEDDIIDFVGRNSIVSEITIEDPITSEIMKDPVVAPDNQMFDRESLRDYVKQNNGVYRGISDRTMRQVLDVDNLPKAYEMAKIIEGATKAATKELGNPSHTQNLVSLS